MKRLKLLTFFSVLSCALLLSFQNCSRDGRTESGTSKSSGAGPFAEGIGPLPNSTGIPVTVRLTDSVGEKAQGSRIAVSRSGGYYLVAWDQDLVSQNRPDCWALAISAPDPHCYAIVAASFDSNFQKMGQDMNLMTHYPHAYGPSLGFKGDQSSLVFYHSLLNGKGTGDRDISVVPYGGFFNSAGTETRLISDDLTNSLPPRNDSTPSLLMTVDKNIIVYSEGYYYDSDGTPPVPMPTSCAFNKYYCDKNIIAKVYNKNWDLIQQFNVTDGNEVGKENSPDIAEWDGGYVIAYSSMALQDPGRSNSDNYVYQIYLKVYDSNWNFQKKVSMTFDTHQYPVSPVAYGGAHAASLNVHGGKLYMAFSDLGRNDIVIWELGSNFQKVKELKVGAYLASVGQAPMNIWTPKLVTDHLGDLRLFHGGTLVLSNGTLQTDIFTTRIPLSQFQN